MSEVKFRADLLCEVNQMPGHIILSDTTFVWKPMKWYPHIGHIEKFECPIEDIIGYSKKNFSFHYLFVHRFYPLLNIVQNPMGF